MVRLLTISLIRRVILAIGGLWQGVPPESGRVQDEDVHRQGAVAVVVASAVAPKAEDLRAKKKVARESTRADDCSYLVADFDCGVVDPPGPAVQVHGPPHVRALLLTGVGGSCRSRQGPAATALSERRQINKT
jgi:hypothetical protein